MKVDSVFFISIPYWRPRLTALATKPQRAGSQGSARWELRLNKHLRKAHVLFQKGHVLCSESTRASGKEHTCFSESESTP